MEESRPSSSQEGTCVVVAVFGISERGEKQSDYPDGEKKTTSKLVADFKKGVKYPA